MSAARVRHNNILPTSVNSLAISQYYGNGTAT